MKLTPKKMLIRIVLICGMIALLILLGLVYGKRRWQESCVSGNELFRQDQGAQTCELQYVKSKK
jgi:hypothetical protein